MKTRKILKELSHLAGRWDVRKGHKFRLENVDPGDTSGIKSEAHALKLLSRSIEMLSHMQEKLYAQDRWALLLIFQGMDTAGKDGAIKHVMSGVNPQGCDVRSFKAPSAEELDHDFLWRTLKACPERGRIGIFNRSYYEEVLVVRVHGELLAAEQLPEPLTGKHIWAERYEDINAHERYLARNGVVIRKFFLHLSKEEQRKRFLERIDDPEKNWKFSRADIEERKFWKDYRKAYEACLGATSTERSPWFVVPADDKENARLIISEIIHSTLKGLGLSYPVAGRARRKELKAIRRQL
jgi:PPK2 family polyphosphate:nucleotide phosphotransferase